MQRILNRFLVLIFVAVATVRCGHSLTTAELNDFLVSQGTFKLNFGDFTQALRDVSQLCNQPDVASPIISTSISPSASQQAELDRLSKILVLNIQFTKPDSGKDSYTMTATDGEKTTTTTGTWKVVDGNTIDLIDQSGTAQLNVTPVGDKLFFTVDKEHPELNCSSVLPSENPLPGAPKLSETAQALQGTWCYYTGYPLYLGVKVDGSAFSAVPAYNNGAFKEKSIQASLNQANQFSSIDGTIDDTNKIATVSLVSPGLELKDLKNPAELRFNGITKSYIKIKFGGSKTGFFKRSDSQTPGECPTLPEINFQQLPIINH